MKKFMKKFVVALAAAGMFASGLAFAVPAAQFSTYGKVTVGYYNGSMGSFNSTDFNGALPYHVFYNRDFGISAFEITPTIGFFLPLGDDVIWGCHRFAVEIQVPVAFGRSTLPYGYHRYHHVPTSDTYIDVFPHDSAFAVNPGADFILNYYPPRSVPAGLQKLSFQLGLGLSASISSANGHWQRRYYDTYNHPEVESGNFNEVGFGIRSNIMMGLRYDFTEHFSALAEVSVGFIGGAASSSRIGVLYRF